MPLPGNTIYHISLLVKIVHCSMIRAQANTVMAFNRLARWFVFVPGSDHEKYMESIDILIAMT